MQPRAVTLRAFRLCGDSAEAALDRLHVIADVRGAIVGDGEVTVWLPGPLPALALPGLRIDELPRELANATATGFERDRAIQVADDLLVRPPWVARPRGFAGIELVVPRGMAFGSGEHGSTQAALLAVHRAWSAPPSFADVGTGSGILARYAQVRGCARIAACDVDPDAVAAARALLPGADVVLGGPAALHAPADFVVANMTAAELHGAWPDLLRAWTGRAALVLSGLRAGEVDAVRARLPAPAQPVTVGGFTALTVAGRPHS